MTQNEEFMHQNMHTGQVPPNMNHGGHEVLDLNEILSAAVGGLNKMTLLRPQVQDPELLTMMDRQFHFMQEEYNITLDCFKSGKDPMKPTKEYMMKQDNDFVYGMKQTQPSKPMQTASEISDEIISGMLLDIHKASSSAKTMAALEATNPVVRRVLADSVPNCIEMAYEVSIYQNKHHYYQVPQLTEQDTMAIKNCYAPSQIHPGGMPQ